MLESVFPIITIRAAFYYHGNCLFIVLYRVYELIHPRVYGCLGVHEYCTMWFSFEVWLHHSTNIFKMLTILNVTIILYTVIISHCYIASKGCMRSIKLMPCIARARDIIKYYLYLPNLRIF